MKLLLLLEILLLINICLRWKRKRRRKKYKRKVTDNFINSFIVKDYASSKTSVMSSLGGFFGFSNAKKKEEDQKEINEFQDKLDKEFYENFRIEEGKLNQEIDDFLQKKSIFDPDWIDTMPLDWVRFLFDVKIPDVNLWLLKKEFLSL